MHGKVGPVPIPFPISPDNACGNWGVTCPIEKGKSYSLKLTMPILPAYPKIPVTVKLELVDGNGKDFFCREFPAKIQAA